MGASSRKLYDREFKLEAVRLADKPDAVDRRIEKDLGLYQGAIRHWREELKADPEHAFVGTGHLKPLDEEYRRLERENRALREERDILKKAMAIFSAPRK
jgi:transposase